MFKILFSSIFYWSSTRVMVAQECTKLVQELIITPLVRSTFRRFPFFDLFDSSLRIFYCFWCKFESIFLVRPSFLWTHVPQLTLRSSRYAALATQFTLHSSPTVWWVNFIWFLLFSFYLFSLNFSFLLEVTFKSKSWYWWSLWGLGALISVLNHLTVSV